MITRNFKELLALVLGSTSVVYGSRPVKDTDGRMWYATPQFQFPSSITTTPTLTANALGISIGTGNTAATENDYCLEAPITSGVTLTLTATKGGCDSPGDPYVEYYITVTNTGSSAITVKEICYKQKMKATAKPGGTGSSDVIVMLDRTVLTEPMTVPAGDAGVIIYKLKTAPTGGKTVHGVKIVDFTYGTDAEIADMIDAARLGTIDLQTDGGWRVGDMRVIDVAAFTGGNSVSHAAQQIAIAIASFDEYEGCGNVLQFDFIDCLTNYQRMNSSNTTAGGYGATEMYTTTLPALAEALPSWLKSRLKTFSVKASKGGSNLDEIETITGNKLALRSAAEIFGSAANCRAVEIAACTQVELYKVPAVRIKLKGYSGSATNWWERSPYSSTAFCYVITNGTASNNTASLAYGVAPFGCI